MGLKGVYLNILKNKLYSKKDKMYDANDLLVLPLFSLYLFSWKKV